MITSHLKHLIFRSKIYLKFIRGHKCLMCARPPEAVKMTAHHERLKMTTDSATPPDSHAVPLCDECHGVRHSLGWGGWEERAINIEWHIIRYLSEFLATQENLK